MDRITTNNSRCEFIELQRTFHELSQYSIESESLDFSQALGSGGRLSWPKLIHEYRLIILSEAGSGKTYEIRNVARTLREEKKPAFFLRLENIPRDFEDAFEVGTYEAFEEWLSSGEEGWILLDSVDEARLRNPRDFELAIRKLSRRINRAIDRTHIIITSRTTAWRPITDLEYCITYLPFSASTTSECDPPADEDRHSGSINTEIETQDRITPIFKIVTIDDLTSNQIALFAKERGIVDSKAFLEAVERADAWMFTSRPQDLKELIEFWIDHSRIGARLELMRNSIDRRLIERDQDRTEAHPLSKERALRGSMLLAAATTLAQNPVIRVPDGAEGSIGIPIQSILPDWDDMDQSILLSRPIFDEAIYGSVRFHHRSVQEYLTAEWFSDLLKHETSRRTIEMLFFRNQYGLNIVVPTLRPILPWLAILDETIRERILKIAPEIIFEGGDPSKLPVEVRRNILNKVCIQIANGTTGSSVPDYSAVQRFSNQDLADDVRVLIGKYKDNAYLTAFLLRMVWLGQLSGALKEAMDVALKTTAEQFVRIAAFRVIKTIGSKEDLENVRQSFLEEAPELNRAWLAELIDSLKPTRKSVLWLVASLKKSRSKDRSKIDGLGRSVLEFAKAVEIELLPVLVAGLNSLLDIPPVIEHRSCEISERYQWLLAPSAKGIERLILVHHPTSLDLDALSILFKLQSARGFGIDEMADVKTEFAKLVPTWKELNRTLFWFEIQKLRAHFENKGGERLTEFPRASVYRSFWRFEESDFEYVVGEIPRQASLDNKLVALSLAFNLYREANRPTAWRIQLKKIVADNDALSERLRTYFRPPAQSQDLRCWKQQEARWKGRVEDNQRKQKEYHEGWKNYFDENLAKDRAELCKKPGTITKSLLYLFDQTRNMENTSSRWTEYNWKILVPKIGEEVARFYRDCVVSFWRNHVPKLHSEGIPLNKTSHGAIIGLIGLEIEAIETKGWPKNLKASEVILACKYASFELNGFPTWFPRLFEMYPRIVSEFLMQEIKYELSIERIETETHYILSDVSCSGQWAWDKIAVSIFELLKATEPKNFSNLNKLLKILQGSTLQDDLIEELASGKCRKLRKPDHVARWFAVWTGVAPGDAIIALKTRIGKIVDQEKQTLFAMIFITHLWGGHWCDGTVIPKAFNKPEYLKSLYLLMHKHIRRKDDINRAGMGAYSPGIRDDAQDARNSLLNLLTEISGKETFLALTEIANEQSKETSRKWILHAAKTRAEQDGDIERWSYLQVKEFSEKLERTPKNHRELAELALLRLQDLKDDLENGDSSIAGILRTVAKETDMRKYIGKELREKAMGRYSIPQEEELADAKRPDLRIHGIGFDAPIPIELKLADKWSGPKLFERLENQLCGDYLRDNHSKRGIYVLVFQGNKNKWKIPGREVHGNFSDLSLSLQNYWNQISSAFSMVDDIEVIGIDLTKRSG